MRRRSIFTVCILACIMTLALAGCGSTPTRVFTAEPQNAPAQGETATATQPEQPTPFPATPTAYVERGLGDFDLANPTMGLENSADYKSVLLLVFDGTRDGQPYHVEKTYEVIQNSLQEFRFLTETWVKEDGTTGKVFSGVYKGIRYYKPAPDQPCTAGQASQQPEPFLPAGQLPPVLGAEAAGQETVDSISADIYTFDQRAIGAGDAATASGKVWVAGGSGHVLKYDLAMQSDTVFGPGITGEQRWQYTFTNQIIHPGDVIPADCTLPLTGAPRLDNATDVTYLPGGVRYLTTSTRDEIIAFFNAEFLHQDFLLQGEAVETSGGTRWVFGRQVGDKAEVLLLTIKPADSGNEVQVTRIETDLPPAQGQ